MYEFHGWLRSDCDEPIGELKDNVPGDDYSPIFIGYVNGNIHVIFSGNPNRNNGELKDILEYFLDGTYNFSGIIYINDSDTAEFNKYKVLKIFNDKAFELEDAYFTKEELKALFE